jgi:hypothetical protein
MASGRFKSSGGQAVAQKTIICSHGPNSFEHLIQQNPPNYRLLPSVGETATRITSRGTLEFPEWTVDVRNVVLAYVCADSIFFAADVQCRLVDPTNLATHSASA